MAIAPNRPANPDARRLPGPLEGKRIDATEEGVERDWGATLKEGNYVQD